MLTSRNNVVHRQKHTANQVDKVGNPGKCAHTLAGTSEREPSKSELDSNTELDSETETPQGSFRQRVSIQLSGKIKPAPKGWHSSAPT